MVNAMRLLVLVSDFLTFHQVHGYYCVAVAIVCRMWVKNERDTHDCGFILHLCRLNPSLLQHIRANALLN